MTQTISGCPNCRSKIDLTNTFRKLWSEHVFWTRSFIISTAHDLGDLQYVTNRLLRNPDDFAAALNPFYGNDIAQKFRNLLYAHLTIAADLVNAAKAGKAEETNEQRRKWYANANEIAEFLSTINPHWSMREWQMMLYDHLKMTEEEATERLGGHYQQDVALFDAIENQALTMADYMIQGIMLQFRI